MTVIIFLLILSILVFVHEMGHFLIAKWAGVRVEEFGFGYPPRMVTLFKKWDTVFSINWIPFGGFVKIFGENYNDEVSDSEVDKKFTAVSKKWQVAILAAGVTFNIIFAWILASIGFMIGMPYSAADKYGPFVTEPKTVITYVLPGSPAELSGIKPGDAIVSVTRGDSVSAIAPEAISSFINSSSQNIYIEIARGEEKTELEIAPKADVVSGRLAIGVSMDTVGTLKLPFFRAFAYGAETTWNILAAITTGIFSLIAGAFNGSSDLSQVAGPVGILGIVGDATRLGFVYLLSFTVLISINLAVINLIPFPALDGGRILFVIIEAIKGSPINSKFFNIANTVGFFILIGLMILITFHDIAKLI